MNLFRRNPNYLELVRLLIDLHLLMKNGLGESDKADSIRDEMDVYWSRVSREELSRIEGLSADLYTLEADSPIVHPDNAPTEAPEFWEALQQNKSNQDYDAILSLLRDRPECIGAAQAAFLRGRTYEELGEHDAAILFLENSVEIDPKNELYAIRLLIRLQKMDRDENASAWARKLINDFTNPSPALLVLIADCFRAESRVSDKIVAPNLLHESAALLERAVANLKTQSKDPSLRFLLVNALLEQAMCLDLLGKKDAAIVSANDAIAISLTADELAFSIRGMLTYNESPDSAVKDFRHAVNLGSKTVWPYFGLAHYSVINNDYVSAFEFAGIGIQLTQDPETLAGLWELFAISLAETGGEESEVQMAFEKAISLMPENRRIRDNYTAFRARVARQPLSHESRWVQDSSFPINEMRRIDIELVSN